MCLNILQKNIPAHLLTFFAQIYEAYLLAPSLTFHLAYLMEFYLAYILAFQRRPRGGRGWEWQAKTGSGRRVCIKSCNSHPGSRAHGPTCSQGLYTGPRARPSNRPVSRTLPWTISLECSIHRKMPQGFRSENIWKSSRRRICEQKWDTWRNHPNHPFYKHHGFIFGQTITTCRCSKPKFCGFSVSTSKQQAGDWQDHHTRTELFGTQGM